MIIWNFEKNGWKGKEMDDNMFDYLQWKMVKTNNCRSIYCVQLLVELYTNMSRALFDKSLNL